MNTGDSLWVLRNALAETGKHPRDLLVEIHHATLTAGDVEIPTNFANGHIIGLWAQKMDSKVVNENQSFTSDLVVDDGKVTVAGPTADTSEICVLIIGTAEVM